MDKYLEGMLNNGWSITSTFTAQGYKTYILINQSGTLSAMLGNDDVYYTPVTNTQ
jgi:hypothetical protein